MKALLLAALTGAITYLGLALGLQLDTAFYIGVILAFLAVAFFSFRSARKKRAALTAAMPPPSQDEPDTP